MRHPSQQHFLAYTIEHILGALFVMSVAMFLGYAAYADTASSTSSTTTSSTNTLTPPLLNVVSVMPGKVSLAWTPQPSGTMQQGYSLFRNDVSIAMLTVQSYDDSSSLVPGATYFYYIKAVDTAGNLSYPSNVVTVTIPISTSGTNPPPPPPTSADIIPPSAPVIAVMNLTSTSLSLNIGGATDNVGVVGYKLFKNGNFFTSVSMLGSIDIGSVTPGDSMYFFAKAIDAAGNESSQSSVLTVTIPSASATSIQPVATPTTSTATSVTFSVVPAPIGADCSSGKPMSEVFFAIAPGEGGSFILSSDNGINNAPLDWGRYSFPNGNYTWAGAPKSGYIAAGPTSGVFTLSGGCPIVSITLGSSTSSGAVSTPTVTSDAFPLQYPENASVVPRIEIDSVQIPEGNTVSGMVTFDVVAKGSTRTVFVLESAAGTKQYIDKQLGVLHKDGTDEWTALWSTTNMDNGAYTLAALMDTGAGTMISKKFAFGVNNTAAQTTGTLTALKKPILKLYVNNIGVSTGGSVSSNDTVEFRVGAVSAKKVNFYAVLPTATSPIGIGQGVIDDLLSGKAQDIWTASWDTVSMKPGSYKVFARVLSLDGTVSESIPFPVTVVDRSGGMVTAMGDASGTVSTDIDTFASREEILARVTTPAECTTKEECRIFCASQSALSDTCISYVRTPIEGGDRSISLASGVSEENLTRVLSDPRKRSDIPTLVQNADDLLKFCADPTHVDSCAKMLVKNDLATDGSVSEQKTVLLAAKEEEGKLLDERVGARVFIDSDGDGISDYDEVNIYHTDPTKVDTDGDGVPDGIEIMDHTNPHGRSNAASISGTTSAVKTPEGVVFEDPLITGALKKELLVVRNVQVAEVGEGADGTSTAKKLLLTGKALPNSYVTLYVFSTPIVVTIKADSSGAWTYTLDKELADGSHQVVSAITDEGGHILAKSDPLPFVKVAAAVSVGSNALLPSTETPGFFTGASLYAFIAILIGLIGVAFSIIGFVVKGRSEKDTPLFPPSVS